MQKKAKYLLIALIFVLVICALLSTFAMKNRYTVMNDVSELRDKAYSLYEIGNLEEAISSMETYCNNVVTDIEAKTALGDWYFEFGDEESAIERYHEATLCKQYVEEDYIYLCAKHKQAVLTEPLQDVYLEITPDVRRTKDMTVTITGHNLVGEMGISGRIEKESYELTEEERYFTTDWFNVDPDGKFLTMSGGFNCAIWQFMDENGILIATAESTNRYREKDTYAVNVYQMARVQIPEDSVYCRVTYFDREKEEITSSTDEELTIVYGRLPGESTKADVYNYSIPDIDDGEKIVFSNNQWTHNHKNGETTILDWIAPNFEKGSHISIDGVLTGKVSFEKSKYASFDKSGIYTIKFDINNPSATGERLDDAKNLGFNAKIGSGFFTVGENHFDNIYPWSEMKLCTIKDSRIIYAGEEGFSNSGNNGDVFVEIPKFYVRRVYDGNYDSISISGEKHEGFSLDDAFITKDGEVEKIYVAAYFTGVDNEGVINSGADFFPAMSLSREEILDKISKKGDGYKEMDYAVLSAVQKLFMVETGVRNSQYLFMGICAYSLPSGEKSSVSVALTDRTKTNCIEVVKKYTFIEGNNIVMFDADNYEESMEKAINDIKKITAVIDNQDGTLSVFFSGDPVEVHKGKTAIAHIVTSNGTVGSVDNHSGAVSTDRGTVGFKYRNIENLWGNMYVYIDGVEILDGQVVVTDRGGRKHTLSYKVPGYASMLGSMVRKLGYDENMPFVMLPDQVSDDVTISTYYGDAFLNRSSLGEVNYLYYGGAWNCGALAGLHSYMTGTDVPRLNVTGRLMYIPAN